MTSYDTVQAELLQRPRRWLVTGAAGFIGSHLVEKLLTLNQHVTGLDNFSTGKPSNLEEVKALVSEKWKNFIFQKGDVCNLDDCQAASKGIDYVLHQAALGSVPRSLDDPIRSHASNVNGFLNILAAARNVQVQRLVFASSSSVYGDHPALPKAEPNIGQPLSPYAATKLIDEIYAGVFSRCYGLPAVGLRYFNVFGPRQDPYGPYAAVIPKWFTAMLRGSQIYINGDGDISRDFCYIDNVVQANLLAAVNGTQNGIYNIAFGEQTTLNQLFDLIRKTVSLQHPDLASLSPVLLSPRAGDIRHSLADTRLAREQIGYQPILSVRDGISKTSAWYFQNAACT